MARTRTTLERYRSIRRPTTSPGGGGGLSSSLNSLAKKQQSAEDAIIDNQYEQGLISAEAYQTELTKRLVRPTLTPLQQVNLRDKIVKVGQSVADASYDRAYSANEVTTDQYLEYQKEKLNRIPQTDTVAYQNQAKTVQNLTDKLERERRQQYRVSEQLRISRLPEDTSERLNQKAALYEALENQARIDGDITQADSFATTKNNYQNASKRAQIGDYLRGVRQTVSEQEPAGLGVPTAEAGSQLLSGQPGTTTAGRPGTSVSGGQPTIAVPGRTALAGTSSAAVQSGYKTLDRIGKQIEGYYQDRSTTQQYISAYQTAIQEARNSGQVDYADQLQISLNNYENRLTEIDDNIANGMQRFEDTQVKIGEAQARAAKSAFSQEVRVNNQAFTKAESDLEKEFARGKITKEEYIAKGVTLAATKYQFFNQAADVYGQYDEPTTAETYLQKASDIETIHANLTNVMDNLDDYEPMMVEPGGTVNNLFGKSLKPGSVSLVNVRKLKDSGKFFQLTIKDPSTGAYMKINPATETIPVDNDGFIDTAYIDDLAKLENKFFVYRMATEADVKAKRAKTVGQLIKDDIQYAKYEDGVRPFYKKNLDEAIKKGAFMTDKQTGEIIPTKVEMKKPFQPFGKWTPDFGRIPKVLKGEEPLFAPGSPGEAVQKTILQKTPKGYQVKPEFINQAKKNVSQTVAKIVQANQLLSPDNVLSKPIYDFVNKNVAPSVQQGFEKAKGFVSNVLTRGGDFIKTAISGLPTIVPRAEAAVAPTVKAEKIATKVKKSEGHEGFVEGTPDEYQNLIAMASKETGISTSILSGLLKHESMGFNPDVIEGRIVSPAGAQGIAQFMPTTAQGLGIDPFNVEEAILGAAKYLRAKLNEFGSMDKALAAYNAGSGNVRKYGGIPPFRETQNYVKNILNDSKTTYGSTKAFPITPTPTRKPTIEPTRRPSPTIAPTRTATLTSTRGIVAPIPQNQIVKPQQQFSQRDTNRDGQIQWRESVVGNAVNNAARNVANYFTKPVPQPKIISPIPNWKPPVSKQTGFQQTISNVQKAAVPVIQQVQKAAAPVVKTVQQAAQNVGKFLGGLFKKK